MKKEMMIASGLVALSFLTAAYFYPQMPERMASHWGLDGQADGYTNREFAVFFMPVLAAVILAMMAFLPRLDPLRKNYAAFQKEYDGLIALMVGFFYYIYLLSIAYNLGYQFDFTRALSPAFGGLFFYMGMLLGKAKQNWFVGIKTPWTLSNEKVWNKTHALGARLFKAAGVIAVLGVAMPQFLIASVAVLLAAAATTFIYSYVEFGRVTRKR